MSGPDYQYDCLDMDTGINREEFNRMWRQWREARLQRDKLLEACKTALEWAAAFPLGIATSEADKLAAQRVYRECAAAIADIEAMPGGELDVIRNCQHEWTQGYANNIGGYDEHCLKCGALLSQTGTLFPPQCIVETGDTISISSTSAGCPLCLPRKSET